MCYNDETHKDIIGTDFIIKTNVRERVIENKG